MSRPESKPDCMPIPGSVPEFLFQTQNKTKPKTETAVALVPFADEQSTPVPVADTKGTPVPITDTEGTPVSAPVSAISVYDPGPVLVTDRQNLVPFPGGVCRF